MIQLRTNNKYRGRIVSTGYGLDMNNPGDSGSQYPFYTDDAESTWPRKYAQQDYVPSLDESQLVECVPPPPSLHDIACMLSSAVLSRRVLDAD